MATAELADLQTYCRTVAQRAKQASALLRGLDGATKNHWLTQSADALIASHEQILEANAVDLKAAPEYGLDAAATDRLRLDVAGIEKIATGMREIAALPDPVGEIIEGHVRPNGLRLQKVRVPLGVVFFIYESRPNVTADAAAICLKSGNAVILRGGKEAAHSSRAIIDILREQATKADIPVDALQLVETTDREAVGHFLKLDQLIDVAIPRGGEGLIRRVVSEARMPVIKHFDGNCHVYVDASAELEMAVQIVVNSKTHRYGVCNACESLLIHQDVAESLLPRLATLFGQQSVQIRGDAATCRLVPSAIRASEADWSTEYLGPIISTKIVANLNEAIEHINRYGSHHTDAIVTSDLAAARQFTTEIDSAAVMVNASTRFNDGGELGLGAEIGISTDKFHARGPCGLRELTSYKYLVYGDGHVRQ